MCSVLAEAGSDGEDSANLPMLVEETVALIALRNAGTGLFPIPQVTNVWIRWSPAARRILKSLFCALHKVIVLISVCQSHKILQYLHFLLVQSLKN